MMPTSLSTRGKSQEQEPKILSGRNVVTPATLGRVEIDAANHHGQRHGIDFDRQRSGVPTARNLEASSFQPLVLRVTKHPFRLRNRTGWQGFGALPTAALGYSILSFSDLGSHQLGISLRGVRVAIGA